MTKPGSSAVPATETSVRVVQHPKPDKWDIEPNAQKKEKEKTKRQRKEKCLAIELCHRGKLGGNEALGIKSAQQ